jgi:hypothetical protein
MGIFGIVILNFDEHGQAFECKQFAIAILKLLEFELNCKERSIKNTSSFLILSEFATKKKEYIDI